MREVIVDLKNFLGNQMFQYAIVKAFAKENNIKFNFKSNVKAVFDKNDKNKCNIEQVFELEESPINVCDELPVYHYFKYINSDIDKCIVIGDQVITDELVKCINDNTITSWFKFRSEQLNLNKKWIDKIRRENDNPKIIACHFRSGKEYRKYGFKIKYSFWQKAADYFCQNYDNVIFVLFYDEYNSYIKKFKKQYKCIERHVSLADDLCAMTLCDGNIICNSTFSIWGAILGQKKDVVCPKDFFAFGKAEKKVMFLDNWKKIDAKISLDSIINYRLYCLVEMILNLGIDAIKSDFIKKASRIIPEKYKAKVKFFLKKCYRFFIKDYS